MAKAQSWPRWGHVFMQNTLLQMHVSENNSPALQDSLSVILTSCCKIRVNRDISEKKIQGGQEFP